MAQAVVKIHIEATLDAIFDEDSYGYRLGKSAKAAIAITRKRCWQKDWVVELDIKGAFDHIDHDLLMSAGRKHVKSKWAILYIERWLKASAITVDGQLESRRVGTPQGGVISPMMMNLFGRRTRVLSRGGGELGEEAMPLSGGCGGAGGIEKG